MIPHLTARQAARAAFVVALGCGPRFVGAQIAAAPPSAADCARWRDDVRARGAPALAALTQGWLPGCAEGGAALAGAITAARTTDDATYQWALTTQAGVLPHPQVLAAALQVARDATAATTARAAAVVVLGGQLGAGLDVAGVAGPRLLTELLASPGPCAPSVPLPTAPVRGAELPADAARQVARVLDPLRTGSVAPPLLRTLARCVRSIVGDSIAPQVDVGAVRLTYLCGTRFRVRNPTPVALPLAYDVYGTSERGDLRAPTGDSVFSTDERGTVRLFYDGRLIQAKANGGAACTP